MNKVTQLSAETGTSSSPDASRVGPSPQHSRRKTWLRAGRDAALCLFLGATSLWWLLSSVEDLGYARDEGFYFQAADSYLQWFLQLAKEPSEALEPKAIDHYWRINHEHPALVKSLFAAGRHFLHDRWHLLPEPGTAYRVVGMGFSALMLCVTYLWGAWACGWRGGLMAALLLALIPRVFYHSHLDCFDVPVTAMWLLTAYAYARSLGLGPGRRQLGWCLTAGLLYGLLLNTKHNAWLLPFALVPHALLSEWGAVRDGLVRFRLRFPLALWLMLTIGPGVFYLSWPWIWHDTFERLVAYVQFHTAHVYYNMEFLGVTYFRPPFPRSYPWLMTFATVPLITLTLASAGLFVALPRLWRALRAQLQASRTTHPHDETSHEALALRHELLWLLAIVVSYAPWFSNTSPIFGGTKHWLTAYPFIALFAGAGFIQLCQRLSAAIQHLRASRFMPIEGACAAACLLGPLSMTANAHPYALSAYTPLVGGAPGGANLGLNRSFWGYTTGAVQGAINAHAKPRAKVFIHDTALQSWSMMERDGRLRRDLRPQLTPAWSDLAVYHHEQHMSRVEHQLWVEYGTVRPFHIGALDGVPVVWLYERPRP